MLGGMPRSPIRSISVPIVLSSIAVLLTVLLLIGWILVLRENQAVTDAIWSNRWLLAGGIISLALIMCVLVMFSVSLVREILESRRQQMFIDSVTHELKSPLASIKLCLDTMEREGLSATQREELRRMMLTDVERLSVFVDDILQASRIAHGRRSQTWTVVDVTRVLQESAESIRHRYGLPDGAFRMKAPDRMEIFTDPTALETILKNVLDNAVKYSANVAGGCDRNARTADRRSWHHGHRQGHRHRTSAAQANLQPLPPGSGSAGERAKWIRPGPLRGSPPGSQSRRPDPGGIGGHRPGLDDAHPAADGPSRPGEQGLMAEAPHVEGSDRLRATVMVVEDEAHLAAGLKLNLELDGYRVVIARSIREATARLVESAPIDLILLDVMLPDGDGNSFCRQLRDAGQYMPVIMLTARSAAEERVRGLDSGADDYMPKPFELPELLARVRSALRRSGWRQNDSPSEAVRGTLRFGSAEINFDTHEATASGKPVRLTQLELDLVHYFSQHPGRVLSREELLERVWKLRNAPTTRSVDNFIVRLRQYFEPQARPARAFPRPPRCGLPVCACRRPETVTHCPL